MDSSYAYGGFLREADEAGRLVEAAAEVMQVRTWRWVSTGVERAAGQRGVPEGVRTLEVRGKLLMESERAYQQLSGRYRALGYVLLMRSDGANQVAVALPGRLPDTAGRPWVAAAFFLATVVSVLFVGATYRVDDADLAPAAVAALVADPLRLLLFGWPFAVSLLGILLAHEMGHYLVARWQGVPATLPYFIPMPVFLLGTMGAVIQIKAPPRNRRALLLLGASGPLAGLAVALPVLLYGLSTASVGQNPPTGYMQEGNSLLYAAFKYLVFGQFLPSGNLDVQINSVTLAGWAGLLVTAMNLIPAGQLDGGHIAYAVLGRRARWLSWGVVGGLVALSFLWQGWLLWATLVLLLGRVHSVPLDDVTPLRPRELAIALLCLVAFVLVFIPIPIDIR